MKTAGAEPAGEGRAAAWAAASKAIVAEAPAIPWLWDQQLTVHFGFTSLK